MVLALSGASTLSVTCDSWCGQDSPFSFTTDAGHDLRNTNTGKPAPVWDEVVSWLRKVGVMNS